MNYLVLKYYLIPIHKYLVPQLSLRILFLNDIISTI